MQKKAEGKSASLLQDITITVTQRLYLMSKYNKSFINLQ